MPSDHETHIRRPNPGGGRRRGGQSPEQRGGLEKPPQRDVVGEGEGISLTQFIAQGRNRVLAAAGPLLSLGARLKGAVFQANVPALRHQATAAVERFNERAKRAGVNENETLIAGYILCAFVDQAVYETPWGSQSDWASHCLLLTFHQELDGGEKFFQILERMSENPARHLDLLELQYVCLLLGFQGRYRQDGLGLDDVCERLARLVRSQRSAAPAALSAHWQGVQDRRSRLVNLIPWWIVGIAGLAILMGAWLLLRHELVAIGAPLRARLASQGLPTVALADARPASRVRLRPLLAAQEKAGSLDITERGTQTSVTVVGSDLFSTGSATLNSRYLDTIRQIGAALERVPGSVTVVGHTDDQPVRSLRYEDNFELSRARAVAVASLLREVVSDGARIQWSGVGDTQPLATPASLTENRARNRRVEILHVAAGELENPP